MFYNRSLELNTNFHLKTLRPVTLFILCFVIKLIQSGNTLKMIRQCCLINIFNTLPDAELLLHLRAVTFIIYIEVPNKRSCKWNEESKSPADKLNIHATQRRRLRQGK